MRGTVETWVNSQWKYLAAPGQLSVEINTLVGVVDAGSYALAAEALGKSQSSVSYAVAQIEERTGVQIFRIQGRKAVLTAEGKAVYLRARYLLSEANRLEKAAAQMALGHEAELR